MDARNINRIVEKMKDDVLKEVRDRLPRKVGVVAVNHFKQNFRDSGFRNNGLHPWQRTLRQNGKGTDAKYGPLTSQKDHLMRSIQARPAPGEVTIEDPVPYATIHNEGGDITTHPSVTPKMRGHAWKMVYSLAGVKGKGKLPKELPREAKKWLGLALTKKTQLTVHAHIPKRQFIGESAELRTRINNMINRSIERIKDGITRLSAH